MENAPTPEDYDEFFLDISAALGVGVDKCLWPEGASATSITLTTTIGGGARCDYYFLVKSDKEDGSYNYDLYQKQ